MTPAWIIPLLSINGVEEFSFSYNEEQKILIDGKRVDGKWVVNVHVVAMPYFAWGCNELKTDMRDSYRSVINRYLVGVLNQLSQYHAEGRDHLIQAIRANLQ